MEYLPTIGLEIHTELNTHSKMFCSCPNDPNERHPNINICPICLGHPGTLPVINEEAVKKVIKTGLALNAEIPEYSKFDRKNYFYPDLPKGYQISQYDAPLCQGGHLNISISENGSRVKKIRIRRIHLEEDTGRLLHPDGKNYSLIDFNRAGIPLMELVTEPDIASAKEAKNFAEELHLLLRYLGVSDANMELGQLRVEVNISLSGDKNKLGTKVEVKNLNSFRAVEGAVDCEIERQTKLLGSGKKIVQETRGWDDAKEITVPQRIKEEAQDYRYFPEPDLPPLRWTSQDIQKIKAEIPELPQQKRERFAKEYGMGEREVEIFVQNKDLGEYFEKTMSELRERVKTPKDEELLRLTKLCANYTITDLQKWLKEAEVSGEDFLITPENFAEFISLIYEGKISSKTAKQILEEMFKTGQDPTAIIAGKGLSQLTDEEEIEKAVEEVISQNPKAVQDFKGGKETALQFLVGQVMAKTRGRANPEILNKILIKTLTN